jgi:hypothetical protein
MSDRFLYYSPSGGMSRPGRSLVIVTLLLLVSLVCFGISAYRFYRYEAGTPTTATVVRCESGTHKSGCYGTWNVGGQPQTGLIRGPSGPVGSAVDVRVSDGTAYAGSPVLAFTLSLAAAVVLAILFSLFAFRLIRRWSRAASSAGAIGDF